MENTIFRPPSQLDFSGNVSENLRKFKQRFNLFLEATGKTKEDGKTQVAILLNLIGEDGIEVFNTFKLEEEDAKDIKIVLDKFEEYCQPLKNVIFERYKFFNIAQKEGKTFDSFLTELQTAASTCEFKEEESMIRDRIVLGISDKNLQERMLREPDLTMKKAAEFCRTAEASRKHVTALQQKSEVCVVSQKKCASDNRPKQSASVPSNKKSFGDKSKKSSEYQCKKCGYKHKPKSCPAYNKVCAKCKQLNHFAKLCPNSKKVCDVGASEAYEPHNCIESVEIGYSQPSTSSLGLVETKPMLDENSKDALYIGELHKPTNTKVESWYETILVGTTNVKFKLDTGAETSILPLSLYNQIGNRPPLNKTNTVLVAFGKDNAIKPVGTLDIICSF